MTMLGIQTVVVINELRQRDRIATYYVNAP